jgi:hypothetical protein
MRCLETVNNKVNLKRTMKGHEKAQCNVPIDFMIQGDACYAASIQHLGWILVPPSGKHLHYFPSRL